jgi:hypothetical protein
MAHPPPPPQHQPTQAPFSFLIVLGARAFGARHCICLAANNAKLNSAGYINNVMSYDVQIRRRVFAQIRSPIPFFTPEHPLVLMEMRPAAAIRHSP